MNSRRNTLKAFERANQVANTRRMSHVEYYIGAGLLPAEAKEALKTPLVQHGVHSNRLTLETAARYSLEQGLTMELVNLEDVFAASTLGR